MDTDGVSSGNADADDDVAQLVALTERKHQIWDQLGSCQDEELRNQLFDELAANREELARLKQIVSLQLDEPATSAKPADPTVPPPKSVGERLRANLLLPPAETTASATPPAPSQADDPSAREYPLKPAAKEAPSDVVAPERAEPPRQSTHSSAGTTAPLTPQSAPLSSRQEDLVAAKTSQEEPTASAEADPPAATAAGFEERRRSAHETYQDLKRVRPDQTRKLPTKALLVALGAVAVVAWLLFLKPFAFSDSTETPASAGSESAATVVDPIRAVLDGLGYSSLLVEDRDGTIYLAGVVNSASDRNAAIAASQALAADMLLNTSGLTISGEDVLTQPPATVAPATEAGEGEPSVGAIVTTGPYIQATLDGKDFVLEGVVPSAAIAGDYLRAAEIAYSPNIRSELMVDEQMESPDWLPSGPNAIVLLPMITEGKILIADDQVHLSGQSPNQAGIDRMQGALGQITGLPVVVGDVEITNLQPPSWVIAADAGAVDLSGEVPTEEIRDSLVQGAAAAYGLENVQDRISVNPNVYPSLWMYSGGPLLQAMATFPDYELRIDGTAFSGFINGNVTFESGSATFSGNYAQVLDVGVSVLTRDPSLRLVIEGHTDDRGSDASNLALSQARAEAVRDYFIAGGIDASRLTAVGIGEAEPVVPNDSEAGRARNRRIQYILTTSR